MKDIVTGRELKVSQGKEEYQKKNPDRIIMDLEMGIETE